MEHEIIQAECPECSPDGTVAHDILKEAPSLLVKCTLCGAIHPHTTEKKRTVRLRVVVSSEDTSSVSRMSVDTDEVISEGDEFIVEDDTGENVNFVMVTSIESNGKRVDSSRADTIQTVWARTVDNVVTRVSITRGWQTESIVMDVDGEQQFTVGEIVTRGPHKFQIKKIKIREGSFLQKKGDTAAAKDIKRIFADSMERLEWLGNSKKRGRKPAPRPRSRDYIIKPRGSATWTLKKKESG